MNYSESEVSNLLKSYYRFSKINGLDSKVIALSQLAGDSFNGAKGRLRELLSIGGQSKNRKILKEYSEAEQTNDFSVKHLADDDVINSASKLISTYIKSVYENNESFNDNQMRALCIVMLTSCGIEFFGRVKGFPKKYLNEVKDVFSLMNSARKYIIFQANSIVNNKSYLTEFTEEQVNLYGTDPKSPRKLTAQMVEKYVNSVRSILSSSGSLKLNIDDLVGITENKFTNNDSDSDEITDYGSNIDEITNSIIDVVERYGMINILQQGNTADWCNRHLRSLQSIDPASVDRLKCMLRYYASMYNKLSDHDESGNLRTLDKTVYFALFGMTPGQFNHQNSNIIKDLERIGETEEYKNYLKLYGIN